MVCSPHGQREPNPAPSGCYCRLGPPRESGGAAGKELFMSENPKEHAADERKRIEIEEDEVTISSDKSFPASDPPSFNPGITGPGDVKKKKH
jgi:hypothetical protein